MKQRSIRWRPLALLLLVMVLITAQAKPAKALWLVDTPWMTPEEWTQKATPQSGLTMFSEVRKYQYGQVTVYGLKNASAAVVVPAEYTNFCYVANDRIIAEKWWLEDGQYEHRSTGMLDAAGNVVFPFREEYVDIIPAEWDSEPDGGNHTFLVESSIRVGSGESAFSVPMLGLYDWDLRELVAPEDASVTYLGDGYYLMRDSSASTQMFITTDVKDTGTRYGLYRYGTGITIPTEYIELTPLGNNLYAARRPDLFCGVLDGSGNQVLPFVFADVTGYRDGYFTAGIFRSQQDYQKAKDTGFLFDPAGDDTWSLRGYDLSNVPSYAVYGVVDRNGAVVSSFAPEYEGAEFDEEGNVALHAWYGKHGSVWPFGNSGSFSGVVIDAKVYRTSLYDMSLMDLLQRIVGEKSVLELVAETGVSVPGVQTPPPATVGGFTDVLESDYFAQPVVWAVEQGITSGTSDTTFSPDATCSTAEILTFLWRANGSPAPTIDSPFSDVPADAYYADAALWACEEGLVSGPSLQGDSPCTRSEVMTYLWRLAGSPDSVGLFFSDVDVSAPYADAVCWAVQEQITTGTGNAQFNPDGICTRGQIVTFLYRSMA